MSSSVQPHWRQPTRLLWTWDSPGKNTGVGFHFLLQCMKVKSESKVTQSLSRARPLATPWTAAYQAPPSMGFSRQEWVAIAFSESINSLETRSFFSYANIIDWSPGLCFFFFSSITFQLGLCNVIPRPSWLDLGDPQGSAATQTCGPFEESLIPQMVNLIFYVLIFPAFSHRG